MLKADRTRYEKISALGCIVSVDGIRCEAPAEIHHIHGGGMGKKSANNLTIPCCPIHHRLGGYGVAVHAGKKAWEARFGSEKELLELTNQLIDFGG